MDAPSWAHRLIRAFPVLFPALSREGFHIAAQPSDRYNCIAYAAGDLRQWWDYNSIHYWPIHAARSSSIESLVEVFAGLGFECCDDSSAEDGFQKIALYEQQGLWKHAAIQTPNGRWRSKMGRGPVIEHRSPDSLSGGPYGQVHSIMRRNRPSADYATRH